MAYFFPNFAIIFFAAATKPVVTTPAPTITAISEIINAILDAVSIMLMIFVATDVETPIIPARLTPPTAPTPNKPAANAVTSFF